MSLRSQRTLAAKLPFLGERPHPPFSHPPSPTRLPKKKKTDFHDGDVSEKKIRIRKRLNRKSSAELLGGGQLGHTPVDRGGTVSEVSPQDKMEASKKKGPTHQSLNLTTHGWNKRKMQER